MTAILEGEVLPPAPDEAPAVVTIECGEPGCSESFTGPAGGRSSASMLAGRHRYAVHGISKNGKGRRTAKSAPAPIDVERHPIANAVHESASQVRGTGVPRAADLGNALGRGLSVVTLMAAGWAVDSDPAIQAAVANPETAQLAADQKDALVRLLSLSEDAAAKIAAPFGRLIAPTALNRKYGRTLVDNTDLGPAVAELVDVGRAWAQFLALRREHIAELRAARQQSVPAGPGPMPAAPPPPPPPPAGTAPAPGAATTPLGAGRVATPTHTR